MGNTKLAAVLFAAGFLTLPGCGAGDTSDPPTDPLDQMSVAFEGTPSRDDIQRRLDAAFAATNTEATADNYSRAGSVLVTFRQDHGLEEMDILDCIPTRAQDPRVSTLDFPSVAAVCVTDMASGQYP